MYVTSPDLLSHNAGYLQVFFWIGSECSVDEQAVAAIKVTVTE